jgi:hypothetical protein
MEELEEVASGGALATTSTPALVVRRCLEVLVSLLSSGGAAAVKMMEQMWTPLNMPAVLESALPTSARKGKGKEKAGEASAGSRNAPRRGPH